MSLSCAIALSSSSYFAGQTPPPTASIVCANGTGSAIVVTGFQFYQRIAGSATSGQPDTGGTPMPPIGPGAPVTVPANGTATIGPFPITAGNVASNQSGFDQPSQVANYSLVIGCYVMASDGSLNTATEASLFVGPYQNPPLGTAAGQLIFSNAASSALWFFL